MRGREVPLSEILSLKIAQYQARLHELRALGFRIPPPRIEVVNGQKHTFYRLEPDPPVLHSQTPARPLPETGSGLLFDKLPERTPSYPD